LTSFVVLESVHLSRVISETKVCHLLTDVSRVMKIVVLVINLSVAGETSAELENVKEVLYVNPES